MTTATKPAGPESAIAVHHALPAADARQPDTPWGDANRRRLAAAIAVVRCRLDAASVAAEGNTIDDALTEAALAEERAAIDAMPEPAAVEAVAAAFRLSAFELHLLLLCAAVELDDEVARLCAMLQPGGPPNASFAIALRCLPDGHWSAVAPSSPLRHWLLVEVGAGDTLAGSPLRIDERILHHLLGVPCLDTRLASLMTSVPVVSALPPSHQPAALRLVECWAEPQHRAAAQLCGADRSAAIGIAAAAAAAIGSPLLAVPAADIPTGAGERDVLARVWQREAALGGAVLLVDGYDAEDSAARRSADLVRRVAGPAVLVTREPRPELAADVLRIDVQRPDAREQLLLWQRALGDDAALALNGSVEAVASQFRLDTDAMAVAAAQLRHPAGDAMDAAGRLWDACRVAARPRLAGLAERIEPAAGWPDLVLPPSPLDTIRQIAIAVAHRSVVHEQWGFAARGERGLGITALFAGASGTGKTMAAEVIAGDLKLDLYRIDLSRVVSKYIGETEKNLARVFDAADAGGVVLLFDEADALFGRRSEVRDSHDRYANIEVSYLLQRMESYRGLAVLTTNMKSALDPAFLRRIRFVVQFPFPDATQRAAIWQRVFPPGVPTHGLDAAKLARLNVAGGNIRNIAVNAAFQAAAAGGAVTMQHVLRAARSEYAKLEKTLTDAEVAGWT